MLAETNPWRKLHQRRQRFS